MEKHNLFCKLWPIILFAARKFNILVLRRKKISYVVNSKPKSWYSYTADLYIIIIFIACLLTANNVSLFLKLWCHHGFNTTAWENYKFILKVVTFLNLFLSRKNYIVNVKALPWCLACSMLVHTDFSVSSNLQMITGCLLLLPQENGRAPQGSHITLKGSKDLWLTVVQFMAFFLGL